MKLKPGTRIMAAFAFILIAGFAALGAMAQSKQPNLSGTWKMNAEKSKFENGGPSTITIKIEHRDTNLSETLTLGTDNGERSLDAKYTTDGKVTTQEVMGRTAQTNAKWEGDALIIDWKADDGGFTRKITLSADGKTMTIVVTQSNHGQSSTDTVVLEKQ